MIYHIHWEVVSRIGSLIVSPAYIRVMKENPDHSSFQGYKHMLDCGLNLESLPKGHAKTLLAEAIKESKEDSFVFILVNRQLEEFNNWLSRNNLTNHVMFRMHRPVTNHPYPDNGRNLTLVVLMSSDHPYHDMFKASEKVNHED